MFIDGKTRNMPSFKIVYRIVQLACLSI